MPFYQIDPISLLSQTHRRYIALSITNLHYSAFNMPAFFVHVSFSNQDSKFGDVNCFIVGKLHSGISNCIIKLARTSAPRKRKRKGGGAGGASIEDALNSALEETIIESSKLLIVLSRQYINQRGRNGRFQAGHDHDWLTPQLSFVKTLAEQRGTDEFQNLLEQLKQLQTAHDQFY
ncbi:cis-3-chloroacrylic acid protein [Colletotrichum incanum]|uniref:Cis-3-chloroacrylic acid protein n=1 Tax=Colletotrichum incanum TaxID=1573173 RepID=A0A161VXW4_COLIC|nr:cis-3-chloroacrylic acid protein [Colletotrichum incanum]OHW97457.1 cis-3-chloroacrylic acid [Colletotrichum incanum]